MHACNCVGPKNGEPLCPCMMRGVSVRDGRYVRVQDLGPVKAERPKPQTTDERIAALEAEIKRLKDEPKSVSGPGWAGHGFT